MTRILDFALFDTKTAADAGTIVQLEDPITGEPLWHDDEHTRPVTITLLGADSGKVQDYGRKLRAKLYEKINRRKDPDLNVEAADAERVGAVVAATIAWDVFPLDGQEIKCTEANARRLYSDTRWPWLLEQLETAMKDRKRFLKPTVSS